MGKVASGPQWRLAPASRSDGRPLGSVLELARVRRDTRAMFSTCRWRGLDSVKVIRRSPPNALEEDTCWLTHELRSGCADHGFPIRARPGWVGITRKGGPDRVRTEIDGPTTKDHVWTVPTIQRVGCLQHKSRSRAAWPRTLRRDRNGGPASLARSAPPLGSVHPDRGATWCRHASLATRAGLTRWDVEWDARPGDHVILTRAADDQGNTQPARIPWNAQGYGYNVPVPHPVKVS